MAYEMYIYPNKDDKTTGWDVSELAHSIQYTTSLKGYPGKLSFVLEKDPTPNSDLQLECGYAVAFRNENVDVFFGYIFTIGTDRTEAYKVTAYDQMRYLQNHDYEIIEDGKNTLDEFFVKVCTNLGLKYEIKNGNSKIKLRPNVFVDESAFDIIQHALDEVSVGGYKKDEQGRWVANIEDTLAGNEDDVAYANLISQIRAFKYHFIRDRFGKIELDEILEKVRRKKDIEDSEGMPVAIGEYFSNLPIIGDESLLTDYQYEISIDKDTYNRIEFLENIDKSKTGGTQKKTFVGAVPETESESQKKWGILKKIVTVRGSSNTEMFNKYKQLVLEASDRISKSITIKAIGLEGLYAGDVFVFDLKKLGVKSELFYITSATHNYDGDLHTMSLEVNQSPNLVGAM